MADDFLMKPDSGRTSPFRRKGAPGTAIYSGYIENKEKSGDLYGTSKYRTFSDILANVSIVAAGTRYFLNLLAKAGWAVEPADESDQAKQIAEAIEFAIFNMKTPWHRVVRRAAMYRFYGFATQEWTAKRLDNGTIGFDDITPVAQLTVEQWDCDEFGEIRGIVQRRPQDFERIYLPREKLVYLVDDSLNDSPEGLGLFRHIAEPARRLQRYEQLEGIGFDTDLRGIPVGRAPYAQMKNQKFTDEEIDAATQHLESFVEDHIRTTKTGLILDSMTYQAQDEAQRPTNVKQWDVDLLKMSSSSMPEAANAIERLNREIARVLGVEQLLLGERSVGSFALSKDKSNNFALIVDGTLLELSEQFEKDILTPLFALNGWPIEMMPTIKTEAIRYRDIEQITGALKDLAASGAPLSPDDPAADVVRSIMGLPERPEDLDTDLLLRPGDEREESDQGERGGDPEESGSGSRSSNQPQEDPQGGQQ